MVSDRWFTSSGNTGHKPRSAMARKGKDMETINKPHSFLEETPLARCKHVRVVLGFYSSLADFVTSSAASVELATFRAVT